MVMLSKMVSGAPLEGDYSAWTYLKALTIPTGVWSDKKYIRWTYADNNVLVVTYIANESPTEYWIWAVNMITEATIYKTTTGGFPRPPFVYDSDSAGHFSRLLTSGKSSRRGGVRSVRSKYHVFPDNVYRRMMILKDGALVQTVDLGSGVSIGVLSISPDGKYIFYNVDKAEIHILEGV